MNQPAARALMTALAAGITLAVILPMRAFVRSTQPTRSTQATQASVTTKPNSPSGRRAMLGVSVYAPATGDGARVDFVRPDSPAATAGLQVGDVLLQFDDQLIFHPVQLEKLIELSGPDHEIKLSYLRGNERVTRSCRLAAAPIDPFGLSAALGVPDEAITKALKDAGIPEGNVASPPFVRIGDPGNAILTLMSTDDGWRLSIRDLTGKEVFSGPLNNEADRAAVPEKYRPILPYLGQLTK